MLTEEGKKRYELAKEYGLGEYYNPYTGNIIIEDVDYMDEELRHTVQEFLRLNNKWVMGYEWEDDDNYYVYVTRLEDLR